MQELAEWEKELRRQQDELGAALAESGLRVEERGEGMARREEQFKELALKLDARQSALEQYEESLARREAAERQKIEAEAEALQAARRTQLDEIQATWGETQAEVERIRQQLLDDRKAMEEQARVERQRMAADHRRGLAELEEQRLALARRSEHVDQCRVALEQLRSELGQMHRETLEIRLATEELWVQLSGAAPAAMLTRSLGQVRAKLAEQYRMANAELAQQRKELEEIRAQLAAQHEKLMVQKRDLDAWAGRRQEEIEQQAARLVAREQELEHQDAGFQQRSRQLQIEQLNYRREILSLRAQIQQSQPDELVATAG